jgi:hypothetical protein
LSLTLRGEDGLRVFENRVLWRIFEPMRKEVTGGWRTLHNEELHNLFGTSHTFRVIKSRKMICAGHVARMGDMRNAYKILIGKPERNKKIGRTRRR